MLSVGQRGELLVAERLLEQGWSVALPFDTTTFALVGVKGDRRVLLQVKSTLHKHDYENTTPHYQFQLAKGKSYKHKYEAGELDYFICVALDSKRFWVFPFGKLDQFTVKVYDSNSRFREFEGAWELLEK